MTPLPLRAKKYSIILFLSWYVRYVPRSFDIFFIFLLEIRHIYYLCPEGEGLRLPHAGSGMRPDTGERPRPGRIRPSQNDQTDETTQFIRQPLRRRGRRRRLGGGVGQHLAVPLYRG